jgi:hypothetical protein
LTMLLAAPYPIFRCVLRITRPVLNILIVDAQKFGHIIGTDMAIGCVF